MSARTLLAIVVCMGMLAANAQAQTTTYRLHSELGPGGVRLLKVDGPDASIATVQSADMKGLAAGGGMLVSGFATAPFNRTGSLAGGIPITFTLWLRKTANVGTIFARAWAGAFWGTNSGGYWCSGNSPALTTTLTLFTFTCSFPGHLFNQPNTRIVLEVDAITNKKLPKSVRAELAFEGIAGGNYDSRVTVPIPPTNITSVTPTSGAVGTQITIAGTNFGATQGASTVTFNGAAATATSWNATSIDVTVPAGATTGPVVVTVGGQASNGVNFTLTTSEASASYVYDALGRLVAVTDQTGEKAVYAYDAVGNLLTITRSTTTGVAITAFSPPSGFAAASFTVTGTGFNATPADNIVTVNGLRAAVTSSGVTEIVATVPVGATSGPISVSTPTGSAVSGSTFIVLGGGLLPNQPTLTSFTPDNGTSGTSVQLDGTNFDPDIADNTVLFNTTAASVTNATPTTLTTTVPTNATSGRMTVITPFGQATSAGDFVIPPAPHAMADVEDIGRLEYGQPHAVDVPQGKIAVFLLEGAVGDWINFELVYTGFPYWNATVALISPSGATVYTDFAFPTHSGIRLPSTGTYSLVVDATDGPATFELHVTRDVVETVNIVGQASTVRVTVRDQYQNLRVRLVDSTGGTFGNRLAVRVSDVAPYSSLIALMAEDGTVLVSDYVLRTRAEALLLDATLPPSGTLLLLVDPELDELGSVTLNIFHPPADTTGTITPGVPTPATNTAAGQNARLLFTGTAGQRVSIDADRVGSISIFTEIRLIAPNGTVLATGELNGGLDFLDALDLPATGTYVVEIDPPSESVGTVTVTLYDITDFTATATIGGPAVNVTFVMPGQNASVTFDGTAGTRVGFAFTGLTSAVISLRAPDGTLLIAPVLRPTFTDATLTQSGTHTLVLDPNRTTTGTMGVTLTAPTADVTASIVPGGPSTTVTVTAAGQNAQVTFDAVAGQRISLQMTAVTIQNSIVTIRKSDGSALSSANVFTGGGFIDTNVLIDSGIYTITIDPSREYTGNMTLTLYNVSVDAFATASIDGSPVTVTVAAPGQVAVVTLAGSSGQHVGINLTSVTIGSSNVSVLNPDGSTLIAPASMTTSGKFLDATLVTSGTYTVRIDPVGTATGSATVTLTPVPADVISSITVGDPAVAVSIPTAGQNARVSFAGLSGQRVSVQMTSVTISSSVVSILKPDDTLLSSTTVGAAGGFIDTNVLPTGGTYTIQVNPSGAATGSMNLTLSDVPADLTGPIVSGGGPVTVAIGSTGQNATLSFTGSVGQRISLLASSVTASSFNISILRPNGAALANMTVGPSGGFIDRKTLSDAGTFTILVDPASTTTGSVTLTLYAVPADTAGTVIAGGPGVPVDIGTPGQNGAVTFDGVVGQQVTVRVTGNTMGSVTVRLLRPDNTTLTSRASNLGAFDLTMQTVPITGPYRVTFDPASTGTGTLTVTVTTP